MSTTDKSGKKAKLLDSYFYTITAEACMETETVSSLKMVDGTQSAQPDEEPICPSDLHKMAVSLLDNIKAMFQPIHDQLQGLTLKLDDTKKHTHTAIKIAHAMQEDIKSLYSEQDVMKQKLLILEMDAGQHNLKLRGFPEDWRAASNL